MSDSVASQYVLTVVDPHVSAAEGQSRRHLKGTLSWVVIFDFFGVLFGGAVHAFGREGRAEGDARDLGTQEVLLTLEEEGVRDDLALELT